MNKLIDQAIDNAAKSIREYVKLGWTLEKARKTVRDQSTLGNVSWCRVELATECLRPDFGLIN